MKTLLRILLATLLLAPWVIVAAQEDGAAEDATAKESAEESAAPAGTTGSKPLPEEYSCMFCHGKEGTLAGDDETKNLIVTEEDLAEDVHWQKGIRCHDCHGGNPLLDEYVDHRKDDGFRPLASPGDIPKFCGHCHTDITYMRRFRPSPRTDQVAKYWTSGHGLALEKAPDDTDVATCVSCHGHHNIRAVDDLQSPVYPTRLAETCAECHSNEETMEGRQYQGKDLGTAQYDEWKKSVHAKALLEDGDLSAPTCNDCHGNHGAVPPDIDSVANACGSCHVKVASLFAETIMKHRFERTDWGGLPGCTACHSNHEIQHPTDEMLGMTKGAVCVECHQKDEGGPVFAAVEAGAEAARQMRKGLEELDRQIKAAREKLDEAKRLGMEVRKPLFELREAVDALTNARSLVHGFALEPMKETLDQGIQIAKATQQKAEEALGDYTERRIFLALFLVPIAITVGLLLLYIRSHPPVES